jgi:ABC-type lipoprotein export system ATPase subunit
MVVITLQISMSKENDQIKVIGAREHNLKNFDISIPKNQLVVFTGVSGSGKSSLAFDTLYNEGQRRYMESFSAYARQFMGDMERPDVDQVYMTAVQLMTQKGGWPLNCFTLPDGRPIYGGTYFPIMSCSTTI